MSRQKPKPAAVGLDPEIVRKLRVIAAHKDVTMGEYLGKLIEKSVDRDYRKALNEMCDDGEAGA